MIFIGDRLDFLSRIRNPYGADRTFRAQIFQRAVIIAAAVTQAMAACVESKQRHKQNARMGNGPISLRFGDVEGAGPEGLPLLPKMKDERRTFRLDARKRDVMTGGSQRHQQQARIGLSR